MSEPISRPVFLTVLCILTFMSSVSDLWTQSERLWNPGIMAEQTLTVYEGVREKLEERATGQELSAMDPMFDALMSQTTPKAVSTSAIITLIFDSLCLYAAFLMWSLQKKGFYLYLIGIAFAFLAPLIAIGGWLGAITAIGSIIISVIMAICYAFHLKYMQ